MKVAFSSFGNTLAVMLDSRLGRAAHFVIFDTESRDSVAVDNRQNLNSAQGAGIQAALTLVRAGAEAVVTGHCGPKAFRVLKEAGIPVYCTDALTGLEALRLWEAGRLIPLAQADVEGHWA